MELEGTVYTSDTRLQAAANTASVRQKEILTFTLPSEAGCLRAEVSTPVTGV
jgi:hypothetical protein